MLVFCASCTAWPLGGIVLVCNTSPSHGLFKSVVIHLQSTI